VRVRPVGNLAAGLRVVQASPHMHCVAFDCAFAGAQLVTPSLRDAAPACGASEAAYGRSLVVTGCCAAPAVERLQPDWVRPVGRIADRSPADSAAFLGLDQGQPAGHRTRPFAPLHRCTPARNNRPIFGRSNLNVQLGSYMQVSVPGWGSGRPDTGTDKNTHTGADPD
jgi:hypothetical protein